jgi:hypothetical protein
LYEKYEFSLDLLACVSNCHQNFFWDNISRQDIFILILSFIALKHVFEKTEFFLFWPNFFPKFADNPCWDLATVDKESESEFFGYETSNESLDKTKQFARVSYSMHLCASDSSPTRHQCRTLFSQPLHLRGLYSKDTDTGC